ncbi:hypothetical protein DPMN_067785 [Dreissena polymorpha]|uniref:Uncharacterized protein n=1 Tax=Dreissena polymorpha TaxID=45954 RepID=A0A9D3YXY0_DREPO|nr:hypothetical protein DPMN_067785 [Dreissena polymorpha]
MYQRVMTAMIQDLEGTQEEEEKEEEGGRDRQTDRQTDIQTDRQTDRHSVRQTDKQKDVYHTQQLIYCSVSYKIVASDSSELEQKKRRTEWKDEEQKRQQKDNRKLQIVLAMARNQSFYLIDEAELPGKGVDCVISLMHHDFQHYSYGEKNAQIHFDNADGQNKNYAVLRYCMCRVIQGLHESISINTMLAVYADSTEKYFDLLKCEINKNAMPPLKTIPVLPLARQWYLYDHTWKLFRSESAKEKTCPKPLIPK